MNQVQRRRNCVLEVPYCIEPNESCEDCLRQENDWVQNWLAWHRQHEAVVFPKSHEVVV